MKLYELLSKELLKESTSTNDAIPVLKSFIKFASDKLQLSEQPKIYFFTDTEYSVQNSSFGGYKNGTIHVMLTNRHINDTLRSVAHELVHFKQDLEGRIKYNSGETGSNIENEANYIAGIIMREWGKKHPALFGMPSIE